MTTVYLKITDKAGKSRLESREAWDVDLFLKSVKKQYKADKENPCKVEISSREEYITSLKKLRSA